MLTDSFSGPLRGCPTLPLELASPIGYFGDRELSRSLADSTVEQHTTTMAALTCCSARVSVSMKETALARPSRSTNISRARAFWRRVKLPVACALGNMQSGVLKIDATSHPSMQWPQ